MEIKDDTLLDFLLTKLLQENDEASYQSSLSRNSLIFGNEDNHDQSNNSFEEHQIIGKKRKCSRRPSFRPAYHPQLRIMKRDIRRRYGEMLCNVVSSHDPIFLQQFLHTFCIPNFQTKEEKFDDQINKKFQWPRQMCGYHRFVQAMTMSFQLFPDAVYRLEDIQVVVALNERGSRIRGRVHITRTQLYDVKFLTELKDADQIDENNHPPYELTLLPHPIQNEIEGIVYLSLDEEHRITSVRIDLSKFSFT